MVFLFSLNRIKHHLYFVICFPYSFYWKWIKNAFVLETFARIATMNLKKSRKRNSHSKCLSWKSNWITFIQLVWEQRKKKDWIKDNTVMISVKKWRICNFNFVVMSINHLYEGLQVECVQKLELWNCVYVLYINSGVYECEFQQRISTEWLKHKTS